MPFYTTIRAIISHLTPKKTEKLALAKPKHQFFSFLGYSLPFIIALHAFSQAEESATVQLNSSQEISIHQPGHILFLLQQGEHQSAWDAYHKYQNTLGHHDHDLLHHMALKILEDGFRKNDPECQLLALFGASITAHEAAYPILEESIKSKFPLVQLVALRALSAFQTDKADIALSKSLGASLLEIRYEAVHQLCLKNHPLALSHAESLMHKASSKFHPLFPPLFAMVDNPQATKILHRLLNNPNTDVSLAVILSAAKYKREDLLPQIRQTALQAHYALQEACTSVFSTLKDEESVPKLYKMTASQYPNVALSAHVALFKMGRESALGSIEEMAKQGNLFAIQALGSLHQGADTLAALLQHEDVNIRINATMALLKQKDMRALQNLSELILRDKRDLGFTKSQSPGHLFTAWKATPAATKIFENELKIYIEHLEFKEEILKSLRHMDPLKFVTFAEQIFKTKHHDLISITATLLEEIETQEALHCLEKGQQQIGAPHVRLLCGLSLMRLGGKGPYETQLKNWCEKENKTELIHLKPFDPWDEGNAFVLKPEEKSRLLIDVFEAFAARQDEEGINVLIKAIESGHEKNKYALSGLLLRAVQ